MQQAFFHKKEKLGALLVQNGKLQTSQLDRAVAHQETVQRRLGEILISLGYIGEEDLTVALAEQVHLDIHTPLENDQPLTANISLEFLRANLFFMIQRGDPARFLLVTGDPFNNDILSAGEALAGAPFTLELMSEPKLRKILEKHFAISDQPGSGEIVMDEADIDKLKDMASEAPVIKYVNNLIGTAISRRSSDIHAEPFEDGLKIRFRIDGILHDFEIPPHALQPAIISRIKLLAGLDIAERRLPQDGKISMRVSGKEIDLRVSTLPTVFGEGVVIRILEKAAIILDLASLGMPRQIDDQFRKVIAVPDGIILVTGPTGSGKTTTLYCALNHINTGNNKIITVEDPVEYQLHGINQIQVRPDIGLTFAQGLRSIVRQDPDIIMIGEIRDLETAEIAVQSSLTGHMVLSTLHTNDAVSAVMRMIDLGVERFLIASSLRGVLAQRLVRRICPHCKEEDGKLGDTGFKPPGGEDFPIYKGKGCDFCSDTGYSGRIGLYEFLVVNDALSRAITKGLDLVELRRTAEESGFAAMFKDGLVKVRDGITTFSEVVRVCRGTENDEF